MIKLDMDKKKTDKKDNISKKKLKKLSYTEIILGNPLGFAYLALENFNNNDEKALEYLDKIQNKLNIENLSDLKSLKKFIYAWMKDWFKNEDMLKSLNFYG